MGPIEAIKTGVLNTFQTSDRASRPEFWWFALACIALIAAIVLTSSHQPYRASPNNGSGPFGAFPNLVKQCLGTLTSATWMIILIPSLSLLTASFRRFRDVNWTVAKTLILYFFIAVAITAFFFSATDTFEMILTKTLFRQMIGPELPIGAVIMLILVFSPLFIVTLIADLILMAVGSIVLAIVSAALLLFLISKLSAPTVSDLTPNEVPS
jgi:uncharacterized membrane protein YhaH (DUF805 family)